MKLTLDQTAVKLGKSVRQVRYLIQQGRLPAQKLGGRWFVESDDVPTDETGRQRRFRREARLRDVAEEAVTRGTERTRYSILDLKAFQILLPVYRELVSSLGLDQAATQHLRAALDQLTLGCHRFGRSDKVEAYRAARDAVSLALCDLIATDATRRGPIVEALEQDFMAAMAGLLRRAERRHEVRE